MSLIGKKVKVTFNPATWPIHSATYTYEGHDEGGYWLRRKDGVQRYFERVDIQSIEPTGEEIDEQPF